MLAKIRSVAVHGCEPDYMGLGPIGATKKALKRASLQISDIGLVELNEAFASQSIAVINELKLNSDIINVTKDINVGNVVVENVHIMNYKLDRQMNR